MSDQNYYQQYVTYADAHDKRDGTRPMYREYLEGQLAIVEAALTEALARCAAFESELAVYRAVHLPAVNEAAGQEGTDD